MAIGAYTVPPLHEARVSDWIRHHIYRRLPDLVPLPGVAPLVRVSAAEIEDAAHRKRCPDFRWRMAQKGGLSEGPQDLEEHRMARLRMGHLRYGATGRNMGDAIGSARKRFGDFIAGGNREHLVDIINLIEIEWIAPNHPKASWGQANSMGDVSLLDVVNVIGLCLWMYTRWGCREDLVEAANLVEREWLDATHPQSHWEALDCGGHWSLRNNE